MVRENNEWRISQAPNALVIPRTFYDQQYQEAEIYFFDPSGRILVPEPVHVPQGIQVAQLASSLVRALVRGPGRSSTGVVALVPTAGADARDLGAGREPGSRRREPERDRTRAR